MKYQPPFKDGVAPAEPGIHSDDPDAGYVNGDPATGTEGSIPPAEAMEHDQRELVHLIEHSQQTPDHEDLEQVRKAIKWMIDHEVNVANIGGGTPVYQGQSGAFVHQIRSLIAGTDITIEEVETAPASGLFGLKISSTGGGGGGGEVTAWENLPTYPTVETPDNKLAITDNGNGTITLDAAQNVLWRGWTRISTDTFSAGARTFTTVANKIYHLRWRRGVGLALEDTADVAYNPTALSEVDPAFDTKFDDMLIARVVTDGSNVATIRRLCNMAQLAAQLEATEESLTSDGSNGANTDFSHVIDWARTPYAYTIITECTTNDPITDVDLRLLDENVTRYGSDVDVRWDFAQKISIKTTYVERARG